MPPLSTNVKTKTLRGDLKRLVDKIARKDASLVEISLPRKKIDDEVAEYIAGFLKDPASRVKILDLSWNQLTRKGLMLMAEAIGQSSTLRSVNLGNNCTDSDWQEEDLERFFGPLDKNKTLNAIFLANLRLKDEGFKRLATWAEQHPALVTLSVPQNLMTDESVTPLFSLLGWDKLLALNIANNELSDEGMEALLPRFESSSKLQSFDYEGNEIYDNDLCRKLEKVKNKAAGLPVSDDDDSSEDDDADIVVEAQGQADAEAEAKAKADKEKAKKPSPAPAFRPGRSASWAPAITQEKLAKIFASALDDLSPKSADSHKDQQAKQKLKKSYEDLQAKTFEDLKNKTLSPEQAKTVADSAKELSKKIADNTATRKDINTFDQKTKPLRKSWHWGLILGALIGAAICFVLGALMGPGGLALVSVGALVGASLFAASGAVAGGIVGHLADKAYEEAARPAKTCNNTRHHLNRK